MDCKIAVLLLSTALAVAAQQTPSRRDAAGEHLTAQAVVDAVLATHPSLAAVREQAVAQRARVKPAGAWPDPTVTVAYMGNAAPFRTMASDPSSYRGITAMQQLPLGGKRELRRSLAQAEVRAELADQLATERELRVEAEAAFYDYFYYERAIEVTQLDKLRSQQMLETTEARYRVGKAAQTDVLRAQLEISLLLSRQATLEQQHTAVAEKLNLLMGRAENAPLPPAAELTKAPLPELSALTKLAEANDPQLQKQQTAIESSTLAVAVAHKDSIPDLSLGYMFQQRTDMPSMYGVQVSLNLPIFYRSKQRALEVAAQHDLQAAQRRRQARRLELVEAIVQLQATAASAAKVLDLYERAILPQAELTLESAQSSYMVGNTNFNSWAAVLSSIHGYRLDYYRQLADYMTARARIAALTGELPLATAAEEKQK